MSRLMSAFLFGAAMTATPFAASAQQPATPAAPPAAAAAEAPAASEAKTVDLDRRVCKNVVPTGTRLSKGRICKKVREWNLQAEDDRQAINKIQRQPLKAPGGE